MKKKPYIIAASIMLIPVLIFVLLFVSSNYEKWTMSEEKGVIIDMISSIDASVNQANAMRSAYDQVEGLMYGQSSVNTSFGKLVDGNQYELSILSITAVPRAPLTKRNNVYQIIEKDHERVVEENLLIRVKYAIHNGKYYDEEELFYDGARDITFTFSEYRSIIDTASNQIGSSETYFNNLVGMIQEDIKIIRAATNHDAYAHRDYPQDYIDALMEYVRK